MSGPLPPIDENVKIPRGVVASSAKADEIHKSAYPSGEQPPPSPENNENAPPAEMPKQPVGQPQPTHPTPPATPPAAPSPPPAAAAVPPETAEDWKQRYNSMKGRFDQQSGQLANTNARLASLETLVSTLQAAPPVRTAPEAAPPRPVTKRVTEDDVKEYGEDLIKVVQRAALDAVEPIIDQRVSQVRTAVQGDLKQLNTKVGGVERETAVSAHQRLLDYLDKSTPHWRSLNRHPKFHNWLGLTDPLSGAIRKSLLDDAVRRGDAPRAATFYDRFLAEEGTPAPAPGQTTSQPPANGNGAGKVSLTALAAPGRPAASGAAPVAPETKEIITRAQISAFYTAKSKGQYSPEEAARLEAEIFAAQKDGRIR